MTLERADIADRLRPLLSAEPQTAGELMTRAGLSINRRLAGVTSAALRQLREEGVAKAQGSIPHVKWTRVDATPQGVETVALRGLDATVTLTTTVRVTPGGTRRTELAAVVELGPSWPAGTHPPPRWSTAFSDAQLATGALAGARSNAIARAEAQLRALRKDKTLPLLPTEDRMTRPNPLLLPSKNRDDFFAYLASIDRGARQDSACAWLAKRAIAQTTDEALAWLDELVVRRLLDERVGVAPDGSRVVRYSPAIPTTPAPLPRSSAPAEEAPPAPAVAEPKGKPTPGLTRETRIGKDTYRGAPPPRAAPVDDQDTGDPTNDESALDDPAEHDSEDPPEVEESGEVARLTRERDDARQQAVEADRKWKDVLALLDNPPAKAVCARCPDLEYRIERVEEARDAFEREVGSLKDRHDEDRARLAGLLFLPATAPWDTLFQRAYENARKARQDAQGEQFATSIAGWLVSLSEEAWQQVQQARTDLAKARDLREQSHALEHSALDALDRAVGARPAAPPAPVAAPAPAPELVPDPIELGPTLPATPEPPASGEQANDKPSWHHMAINPATGERTGTTRDRVLTVYLDAGAEVSAQDVARRLGLTPRELSGPLSKLTSEGKLERTGHGTYRIARKGRRAA